MHTARSLIAQVGLTSQDAAKQPLESCYNVSVICRNYLKNMKNVVD